jgi:hypothetical protein
MNRVWIIGGGKFGTRAAERILRSHPEAEITIVDRNSHRLPILPEPSRTLCMDGIDFLHAGLGTDDDPDWIVPAIPVHVAFEWSRRKLSASSAIQKQEIPLDIIRLLPNPIIGKDRTVYASIADFICPDNCPEPAEFCTFTQAPRPFRSLYEKIRDMKHPLIKILAIQSRQLFPGVGGIWPGDMFRALNEIQSGGENFLIATSCRCHGVLDAFELVRKDA